MFCFNTNLQEFIFHDYKWLIIIRYHTLSVKCNRARNYSLAISINYFSLLIILQIVTILIKIAMISLIRKTFPFSCCIIFNISSRFHNTFLHLLIRIRLIYNRLMMNLHASITRTRHVYASYSNESTLMSFAHRSRNKYAKHYVTLLNSAQRHMKS